MSYPAVSFTNRGANTTTPTFVLPAGVGEMQLNAVDPGNPGTCSLLDSAGATVCSVSSTYVAFLRGFGFGSVRFQTLGGTYSIRTTADAQNVTIYFDEA
jgi:hypothetical protein